MMEPAVVERLVELQARVLVEAADADLCIGARPAAEALQRELWLNRDALIDAAADLVRVREQLADTLKALRPFGLAAQLVPASHHGVLFSMPAKEGRTFVQFRAQDFRRAAQLSEAGR